MRPITATYRLQLRGDAFTLDDARRLADYLDRLGVSHLYLSPILTATAGSTHGYDVIDPTTVSAEIGGRAALVALSAELAERDMGLIVDLVPNHVGVGRPRENRWWWDVLTNGRRSPFARFFDVDWREDNGADGRIALPVLADESDLGGLSFDHDRGTPMLALGDQRFPIAPGTEDGNPREVHDRQAYRLVGWRDGAVGYRRFFAINDLAALRQEDQRVFDTTHHQFASWVRDELVDGVRVDHPDGLSDPSRYLRTLREVIGTDRWLLAEKVLAAGEPLDPTLPIDGTTGYDALAEYGGVFVDPAGEATLTALADRAGAPGDAAWLRDNGIELRRRAARTELAPEVRRLVRAVLRDSPTFCNPDQLRDALVEVLVHMPVYRADYAPLAGTIPRMIGETLDRHPEWAAALTTLAGALTDAASEASTRFHQVCGALTAKAVEDCLFYRTSRLVSLLEVGGDPGRFGCSPAEFHLRAAERARLWPRTMTTLSTHDTKRGEDVRARIGVLSQVPELWARCVADWEMSTPSPDGTTGLFLWQNMFGVWPADGSVPTSALRGRLHQYAEKATREAGLRTAWTDIDQHFETALHTWLDRVADGPVGRSIGRIAQQLAPHGWSDALGQKLLQLCGPGVPDVYQGTELWEDSLVDPDNRRPVDYRPRRRLLQSMDTPGVETPPLDGSGAAKLHVTRTALRLRRERPDSFVGGHYRPMFGVGPAHDHLVGFARGPAGQASDVIVLATRHSVRLNETGWGSSSIALPNGSWFDRLTGELYAGAAPLTKMFDRLPVALLVRLDRP
ncbi:malto-oligosyltrehalose synthase [Rhodococcus sp. TAF43]|uniref:malto-oligosyltrehalose synthase n=1 Tax=unclassified Rhodococcus (in: high G+C Gram-positive bacteria) TaxID=192944 RepID=UPI0015817B88|nr:malto-oligosyltrehalose synthase [Rhodococcus sp. W8901]QKT11989.1 malto-oligosyltrehalose synthase [Rhodococcus sp. W8901]